MKGHHEEGEKTAVDSAIKPAAGHTQPRRLAVDTPSVSMSGTGERVGPPLLERMFDRHFASSHLTTDFWGTAVGCLVYLGLMPTLWAQGRHELAVVALLCAAVTPWPFHLSWLGCREFYLWARDYLLFLHFMVHYNFGGQFARYVRLHQKLHHSSLLSFLVGFVLSSTLPWQAIDSLLFRMRARRFLLLKPLVLLSVVPLEASLCQLTCEAMPEHTLFFVTVARFQRKLLRALAPLSPAWTHNDDPSVSCLKVQIFLQMLLSYALPAALLYKWEARMRREFAAERRRWQGAGAAGTSTAGTPRRLPGTSAEECEAGAPLVNPAAWAAMLLPAAALLPAILLSLWGASMGVTIAVSVASTAVGLAMASLPAAMRARRRAGGVERGEHPGAHTAGAAAAAAPAGWRPPEGFRRQYPWWVAPLVLSGIAWHLIDMLPMTLLFDRLGGRSSSSRPAT